MGFFSLYHRLKSENADQKGLFVTPEELIDQQQYLSYLNFHSQKTSYRAGDVKSVFKGRGIEFEEVRSYNFGDDVRDIDWRVTARKSEPYTKIFSEEKDREIIVILDLSSSMIFGTKKELKSVTACKITALLGWMTIHNKDRFGLLIFDGKNSIYLKPQNDVKSLIFAFGKISDMSQKVLQKSYDNDISEALKVIQYHHKGQGVCFILSDFYHIGKEQFKKIAILSEKYEIYCLNIFDVIEETAPLNGIYAAEFNNDKIIFDTHNENFRENYRRYFIDQRLLLKQNCQKFFCKYMEIRTDMPIFKQLSIK